MTLTDKILLLTRPAQIAMQVDLSFLVIRSDGEGVPKTQHQAEEIPCNHQEHRKPASSWTGTPSFLLAHFAVHALVTVVASSASGSPYGILTLTFGHLAGPL